MCCGHVRDWGLYRGDVIGWWIGSPPRNLLFYFGREDESICQAERYAEPRSTSVLGRPHGSLIFAISEIRTANPSQVASSPDPLLFVLVKCLMLAATVRVANPS